MAEAAPPPSLAEIFNCWGGWEGGREGSGGGSTAGRAGGLRPGLEDGPVNPLHHTEQLQKQALL